MLYGYPGMGFDKNEPVKANQAVIINWALKAVTGQAQLQIAKTRSGYAAYSRPDSPCFRPDGEAFVSSVLSPNTRLVYTDSRDTTITRFP